MKILHYSLGYPPMRSGGLTYYTIDLMKEQVKQGHEVIYLFPGKINLLKRTPAIIKDKKRSDVNYHSYELVNSLPLPLFGGIKQPKDFMKPSEKVIFQGFLEEVQPDVVHIHTLMGLYREFVEEVKNKKIKIVYTSHDYFGLSPNPTFYYASKSWANENSLKYWLNVSSNALSTFKLRIFQLPFYTFLRNQLKKIKGKKAVEIKQLKIAEEEDFPKSLRVDFIRLRMYYQMIFELFDCIHFNSSLAQKVYHKNLEKTPQNEMVIPVSNATIHGGDKEIGLEIGKIKKVAYIGPYLEYKGFDDFLHIAKKCTKPNLEFEVLGDDRGVVLTANIANRGRFPTGEKNKVYESIDLLVVPSKCMETFGMIVLEALNCGTPVIVSSCVGAKDLLPSSFVLESTDFVEEFIHLLESNETMNFIKSLDSFHNHVKRLESIYGF